MGFENVVEEESLPLWEHLRDQFPVTRNLVYLNHASIAPLSKPAADAMISFSRDALFHGSLHYPKWLEAYEKVRRGAARMLHAEASEIALIKNTSEGISTVATGIAWKPGDRIVAFSEEFPANFLPWKRLEAKGVTVEWLSVADPLERVEQAARGARLLAISYVQYISGFRADLKSIGEICRRHDVFFFVDAIQGLGAFALDVRAAHIDALAADGHKWLLGPEGCGILYVRKERLDEIDPVEFGWTNVAAYNDYTASDMSLRPDAGRYECGTLNTVGCFGLAAAIEFLLEVGIHRIAPAIHALAGQIEKGVQAKGYQVMHPRTLETGSGIVSFRKPGVDSQTIVDHLAKQRIIVAQRHGWIRSSPHFYLSPKEIGRALEALP
jgi:selenocysteine lyase/cysteine desulfurase